MNANYICHAEIARMSNGTEEFSIPTANAVADKLHKLSVKWQLDGKKTLVAVPAVWEPHCPEKGGERYRVKGNSGLLIVPADVLVDALNKFPTAAYSTRGKFIPVPYSPRQLNRLSFCEKLKRHAVKVPVDTIDELKARYNARKLPNGVGVTGTEFRVYFLEAFE